MALRKLVRGRYISLFHLHLLGPVTKAWGVFRNSFVFFQSRSCVYPKPVLNSTLVKSHRGPQLNYLLEGISLLVLKFLLNIGFLRTTLFIYIDNFSLNSLKMFWLANPSSDFLLSFSYIVLAYVPHPLLFLSVPHSTQLYFIFISHVFFYLLPLKASPPLFWYAF